MCSLQYTIALSKSQACGIIGYEIRPDEGLNSDQLWRSVIRFRLEGRRNFSGDFVDSQFPKTEWLNYHETLQELGLDPKVQSILFSD